MKKDPIPENWQSGRSGHTGSVYVPVCALRI